MAAQGLKAKFDSWSEIMGILSFLLFVIIGCLSVYGAQHLKFGAIPGGFATGAIVGTLGAWGGGLLPLGPEMAGVFLVPSVLGAFLMVFAATYVQKTINHNS